MRNIILASGSPRRAMLMRQMGLHCTVCPSEVKEHVTHTDPALVVEELSRQKCEDVASRTDGVDIVVGADTVVAYAGKILGKPADDKEAAKMIRMLSGAVHQVFTGVTLMWKKQGVWQSKTFHEQTDVEFFPMSEEEILEYIYPSKGKEQKTPEWADKAGGYGIQTDFGTKYIRGIRGDYYNVVGLPASRLYQELKAIDANEK
ncbi:MAG: Maf family protein [Fusicatenibacter sp.]|nr:Maf family protein [Fusicatenibacter sp.]